MDALFFDLKLFWRDISAIANRKDVICAGCIIVWELCPGSSQDQTNNPLKKEKSLPNNSRFS